jgi:hypothetical protein
MASVTLRRLPRNCTTIGTEFALVRRGARRRRGVMNARLAQRLARAPGGEDQ